MDNSKDVSQEKKSFVKLFGWGIVLAILAMFCILAWANFQGFRVPPITVAQSELQTLRTVLEAHYADYLKYPQPDKVSYNFNRDDVTVYYILTDEQHYFAMAFNIKEGDRLYFASSDRSIIWWIPFPKQGLVTAMPL
jgi:hypothetical protein